MAVNTWVVSLMRYDAGIVKRNADELRSLEGRTRNFMTMHGVLHLKSDVARVCLSRQIGGRGLISCEGCIWMEKTTRDGMTEIQWSHRVKV